ncbi:endonuclease/exonuclease/phosphatase family metal-dependent hydrolase [Dysgonomonas hofstadii]|uniref:Endonuclease/exonuclease/phosphatase family metal-dependent hydrolase n=1 Tax=Dysgonomonas hofstadii TaxID=637886 RepID=A0A840CNM7_9BACT|nr:endonuclease/exonuclease/phosphatase family protein [Dysgonomonas hofstadii]MBB4034595.1 endonuclease/exonuclease/phosphatase family metal-dependent hydrolase [Dysgonomonas hofstadii]
MNGCSRDKYILLLFLFLFLPLASDAQEKFRIAFYNVENLYDTKDNPDTNDDDLTPEGNLRWSDFRYWKKLHDISKVLISVGEGYPPALIGLCEVENDSVLFDLTKRAALNRHKYEYIITTSKDHRGSNTALLYQRDQIKIISKRSYTPYFKDAPGRTTRDILHVTGKIINGDVLDIFVCHFPSRSEGIRKTRPYRIECARLLRQKTDSLSRIRRNANIIIMGDFNDYPADVSMKETLEANGLEESVVSGILYNMFYHKSIVKNKPIGTYKYRGKWDYIDQIIVSGNLLDSSSRTSIKNKEAHVYLSDFLLEKDNDKYGGMKPFRTYSGWKYLGGYSDHLPVYIDMVIKE